MQITKKVLKSLPKVAGNDEEMTQMEYVHTVLGGSSKPDALKEHFPELHQLAIDRANGNDKVINANIKSQINTLERRVTVKKMYEIAHKHAWTNFLDKKHKLYENLYNMAMDDGNSVRDRQSCSKTLLDHMPKFEEDKTLVIEVKDGKAEFGEKLRNMQILLHKQANKDVIDVEAEDE